MYILRSILYLLPWINTQAMDYFMMEKFYMCEDVPEQPIKIYMTSRSFTKGRQTVDFNLTSPKAIGENSKLKSQLFIEIGNHWQQISRSENDFCYIFKTYVGQLFYDLERAIGVIPGTCPIPRGIYHAVNYTFDYEKLKLQSFAVGRLKFRMETHDKTTKMLNSCVIVIIQTKN